jgi:hypothetical protein
MHNFISLLSFRILRVGRCPACGRVGRFTKATPALRGPIPAEVQGAVPLICRCANGCTSSVRAITERELRTAKA